VIAIASGAASPTTNRRPSRCAAAAVVPEPTNQSPTRWPGTVVAAIRRSINRWGFCDGQPVRSRSERFKVSRSVHQSSGILPSATG
jgi:hypothetical protein